MLDVPQILEEIQMVGLYVQNHRHSGIKAEKAVALFGWWQTLRLFIGTSVPEDRTDRGDEGQFAGSCINIACEYFAGGAIGNYGFRSLG